MTPNFAPEQIAKFEAALACPEFGFFAQTRLFGLSLADRLGQPMDAVARAELGTLRDTAELLATALIADWRNRFDEAAENRVEIRTLRLELAQALRGGL